MYEEDLEIAIKVVIVGNGAVGKSSMIQRYCKGIFTKDYKKTIGVDFLEREIEWVVNSMDTYLDTFPNQLVSGLLRHDKNSTSWTNNQFDTQLILNNWASNTE